jgi:hypothetical protein
MGRIVINGVVGVRQAPATPYRQGGVQAQHARGGALDTLGRRVTGKRPGVRNGEPWVGVTYSDGTSTGSRAERVLPGSAARRDLLAGPTTAGRCGDRPARVGRGDGESSGDRHSRLIDSITYDTAATVRFTRRGR